MNIFGAIMDKIFHHPAAQQPGPAPAEAPATQATAPASQPAQAVDVEAVLTEMASNDPSGGGNWRSSIVDLLKLLGLDSSLTARKQLAEELNVHAGEAGTAEENIALHKAVMQKLAENGGKVPDSLKG